MWHDIDKDDAGFTDMLFDAVTAVTVVAIVATVAVIGWMLL